MSGSAAAAYATRASSGSSRKETHEAGESAKKSSSWRGGRPRVRTAATKAAPQSPKPGAYFFGFIPFFLALAPHESDTLVTLATSIFGRSDSLMSPDLRALALGFLSAGGVVAAMSP
jgi:hypothetical protein